MLAVAYTLDYDPSLLPPLFRSYVAKRQIKNMSSFSPLRIKLRNQTFRDIISIYSRPMHQLLQQIVDDVPLSEYEEERVLYFITYEERQWLEAELPTTHPFLQELMEHNIIFTKEGKFILI